MRIKNICNAEVNFYNRRLSSGEEIEIDEKFRKDAEENNCLEDRTSVPFIKKKKVRINGNI